MKYRYEGEGEPANELHDFGGDIELRLDLEDANGRRSVDTIRWSQIRIPAFPGAEGAGKWALGGRYGEVYKITTLADSAQNPVQGMLRHGIENRETIPNSNPPRMRPRTIVFDVAGTIQLESDLVIAKDKGFLTIAGHSAPGDGICLKNRTLVSEADHVVIRYLRIRPGDQNFDVDGWSNDIDAFRMRKGSNVILDHCSLTWGIDGVLDIRPQEILDGTNWVASRRDRRVSVQWCILGQTLNKSWNPGDTLDQSEIDPNNPAHPIWPATTPRESHSLGMVFEMAHGSVYSVHHNLITACVKGRMPKVLNTINSTQDPLGGILDFRSNVTYNWHDSDKAGEHNGGRAIGKVTLNYVNNLFRVDAGHAKDNYIFKENTTTQNSNNSRMYEISNFLRDQSDVISTGVVAVANASLHQNFSLPHEPILLEVPFKGDEDASDTLQPLVSARSGAVSSGVGGNLSRDVADLAIIGGLNSRTNNVIDSPGTAVTPEPRTSPPFWDASVIRIVGVGYPALGGSHPADYDTDSTTAQVDGMEDAWETSEIIAADTSGILATLEEVLPYGDFDGNGYSNLEDYLNSRVHDDSDR